MATTLAEQVAIDKIAEDRYESRYFASSMANSRAIAYGGCALAVALNAAAETVPDQYRLYSALGHYLGPAQTDRKLFCTVHRTRQTRTFSTRRVQVLQILQDGIERVCLELIADFHVQEPALLTYYAPPTMQYTDWRQCPTQNEVLDQMVASGKITEQLKKQHGIVFGLDAKLFNTRYCPEGIASQNLTGLAKTLPTTQDSLPLTSKSSGDWHQVKAKLSTRPEQVASLGFLMDGAIAFACLTHNHQFLEDAGACSSLDFALRVFLPEFDLNDWHLRELITHVGDAGRTYSESRLWNDSGKMVASMTQQGILRKPAPATKL